MLAEETPQRIEPARLEDAIPEPLSDLAAELASASAKLGHGLHPRTAANLAALVRLMNTYYSNLIEGHNTRPKDIERALAGQLDGDEGRRNLQIEAAAHVRVQAELDRKAAEESCPNRRRVISFVHCSRILSRCPRKCCTSWALAKSSRWSRVRGVPNRSTTSRSVAISRHQASALRISWPILRGAIGSHRSARRRAFWPFQPHTTASTTFIHFQMEMAGSAA